MPALNTHDYAVVIVYVIVVISLPFVIAYRKRKQGFLALTFAGRELGFWSIALTMFLSNNGTAQLTGMAGWAVRWGLGIYGYELMGSFGILTLGWIFMPVYMASGVLTTIDYATKRFGGKRIPIVMVILMMVINLTSKFSMELHTTNVMLKELYPKYHGLINLLLLIGGVVVVIPGGLYSLVYTSNIQFAFFAVGMPVVFLNSYYKFTSWQEIRLRYQKSWPSTTVLHVATSNGTKYRYTDCGIPDVNSMDLIRTHDDPQLPWPGLVFGIYIISIYQFCIDQSILQYCLGAKNIVHAKYACIMDGYFKICTIFFVMPGLIARVLYTNTAACADPDVCEKTCGMRSGCEDLAIAYLFNDVVPLGWRGAVLTAYMSATLTSLASTLHAGSTVFVINLYRPLRPWATEFECTAMGKLVVLVQAVGGMFLASALDYIPGVQVFMRQIYATLAPPLVAVYLSAIFWDRLTEKIAFRTLILGTCIAVIRLSWKLAYGFVPCGDESNSSEPDIISNLHDLHFAILLFVICVSHIVITGSMSEAINHIHLYRLLFWLRFVKHARIDIDQIPKSDQGDVDKNKKKVNYSDSALKNLIEGNQTGETTFDVEGQTSETTFDVEGQMGGQKKSGGEGICMITSLSFKPITDEILSNAKYTRTLEKEKTSEYQSVNSMLLLLLLIVVFVLGFFT